MYHLLRTPEQRTLEVKDAGPKEGRPLLLFHGFGGSASAFPTESLKGAGVRLIVLNRPGTGASTPKPFSVAGIAADARWVLEQLLVDRVEVAGWAAGAVYALGFAAAFPQLVTGIHLLAPALPGGDPAAQALLPGTRSVVGHLERLLPAAGRWRFRSAARALAADPDRVLRHRAAGMPEPDQRIALSLEWRDLLLRSASEGYSHQGAGVQADRAALDTALINWSAIKAPVRIWSGDADNVWPPATAAWLRDRLPGSAWHTVPGAGHLFYLSHWEQFLDTIPK
ncbi:alpha/beta hydrolase [Flaviaesturariibacter amylovorans]|uniref:Alpha/beta hydrolase n=1 Tax=Flaviaesturariibacter amylovorans TaxID=1084520 RepID=A0ABP8HP45_9BACT